MKTPNFKFIDIEDEVLNLSKFIYITDGNEDFHNQLNTFSPYIADLLVQCCVQIEAASKELYYREHEKSKGKKNPKFDYDCLKFLNKKWDFSNKIVNIVNPSFNLSNPENYILTPLLNCWVNQKELKPNWMNAYQDLKHDRYNNVEKGNIINLLNALAALYLLNIYLRNERFSITYMDLKDMNFSFGSKLFTVNKPKVDGLWNDNIIHYSSSPFIGRYRDDLYEKIENQNLNNKRAVQEYLNNDSDFNSAEFVEFFENKYSKIEDSLFLVAKLQQHKLTKLISNELDFNKKKEKLINSNEWSRANHGYEESDVTENYINEIIAEVGYKFGLRKLIELENVDQFASMVMNNSQMDIFIPENCE